MSFIKELEQRIEAEGIIQISGGVFKQHTRTWMDKEETVPVNTTPESYCKGMGELRGCTGEEYAESILKVLNAKPIPLRHCTKCDNSQLDCFCEVPEWEESL